MFTAEMVNDCDIDDWDPNSRVVHTMSTHTIPLDRTSVWGLCPYLSHTIRTR